MPVVSFSAATISRLGLNGCTLYCKVSDVKSAYLVKDLAGCECASDEERLGRRTESMPCPSDILNGGHEASSSQRQVKSIRVVPSSITSQRKVTGDSEPFSRQLLRGSSWTLTNSEDPSFRVLSPGPSSQAHSSELRLGQPTSG